MKKIEYTKHIQRLSLKGNLGTSFRIYPQEREKIAIKRYELIYLNNSPNCEIVKASHETDHRFDICLNERQARAVVSYEEQKEVLDIQKSGYRQRK